MKNSVRRETDYWKTEVAHWKVGKRHNKSETRRGFPFITWSVNISHAK